MHTTAAPAPYATSIWFGAAQSHSIRSMNFGGLLDFANA